MWSAPATHNIAMNVNSDPKLVIEAKAITVPPQFRGAFAQMVFGVNLVSIYADYADFHGYTVL
jgi:hypothetical protein